uniref:Rab-GAP TBC domain-containing protein n=1 Tax=Ditylenchus dipsaci TaxID=166011 RepID=A0A915D3E3_9BILA
MNMDSHKATVSATFSELFKKAHGAIANLRGVNSFFLGKNGEIIYSKNNVCVHEATSGQAYPSDPSVEEEDSVVHTPGYLTITCQHDEQFGVTLVLQWLPNTTLEKNPASIRCVSPRSHTRESLTNDKHKIEKSSNESDESEAADENCSSVSTLTNTSTTLQSPYSHASTEICVEMEGEMITLTSDVSTSSLQNDRPQSLGHKLENVGESAGLGIPSINLIPNTPMEHPSGLGTEEDRGLTISESSDTTSGADEASDKEEGVGSSSSKALDMASYRRSCETMISTIPEQFAKEHNLMYNPSDLQSTSEEDTDSGSLAMLSKERVVFQQKPSTNTSLLQSIWAKCGPCECSTPTLSAPAARSPSPLPDRHLLICHPEISRTELDPEDGLYDKVSWELWKSYKNADGSIDDGFTIRKAVYFASMDFSLRKEIWPFLLRVYPWTSTFEQREAIRNDLFLSYQNIKPIESTIVKDVVRTDRRNPFFAGDNNPNLETMKSILLNYAVSYPDVNYIQGMSDLLAPLLSTLRDETDTYWCFAGLMQQTLFCSSPKTESRNIMEINLEYLRELMKLLVPDFYTYLLFLGGDAPDLMFVHRWILLFFRESFQRWMHCIYGKLAGPDTGPLTSTCLCAQL